MLKQLENTLVHCRTQEEYDELMDIYNKAGWVWSSESNPKYRNNWLSYTKETCVEASDYFLYGSYGFYKSENRNIISLKEFKEKQGLINPKVEDVAYTYSGGFPIGYNYYTGTFEEVQVSSADNFTNKNMSIIKNTFKSKESKAIEHFGLGSNSNDLNHDGLMEFVQYIYENDKENKKGFLAKLVEAYKEVRKIHERR